MADLASFLLLRIANDESAAQELLSAESPKKYRHTGWAAEAWSNPEYLEEGISLSPERLLADCNSKRRLIELHGKGHECTTAESHGGGWFGAVDGCPDCPTLRLLALPYASHPDFDDTWGL